MSVYVLQLLDIPQYLFRSGEHIRYLRVWEYSMYLGP